MEKHIFYSSLDGQRVLKHIKNERKHKGNYSKCLSKNLNVMFTK